jgi:hypothetical protein
VSVVIVFLRGVDTSTVPGQTERRVRARAYSGVRTAA